MVSFTSEGWVSIWVGQERGDPNVDILHDLCGVEYYDVDFQECIVAKDWAPAPIASLLERLSFAESFLAPAFEAARQKGLSDAVWVVMQLDFAYDPLRVTRPVAADPVFLGTFPWHE
jgi:hypothetical protein